MRDPYLPVKVVLGQNKNPFGCYLLVIRPSLFTVVFPLSGIKGGLPLMVNASLSVTQVPTCASSSDLCQLLHSQHGDFWSIFPPPSSRFFRWSRL